MTHHRFVISDRVLAAYCPTATGQGHDSWNWSTGQPSVSRSRALESGYWRPLAGSNPLLWQSGTASSAASDGGPSAGCLSGCFRPSVAILICSLLIDGAIVPVHQKASGSKGGLNISPLTDPGAG